MTDTINLGLPYIDAAQAQKHVTHNEALRILDTLVQLAVLDRDLATPPGSPSEGQRWLVAASPTGAWLGHTNHVAAWQDGAWQFSAPRVGWLVYIIDEGRLLAWNGTAWTDALSMLTTLQNITLLGVGTAADSTNSFSAKLNNALWAAKTVAEGGDGHLRYKLSKESASKTLSLLFQDNFSGRAELGLTGDDNFHFKVSSDGSSWKEALCVDVASGKIGLGTTAPTQILDAVGSAAALAVWDNRSYAAGRGGSILLQASNDGPARFTGGSIAAYATTGTAGAEVTDMVLSTMKAGTLTEALRLLGSGVAKFAATTAATSTTTGCATFAGGIGVAGAAYLGGLLEVKTAFAGVNVVAQFRGGGSSGSDGAVTNWIRADGTVDTTIFGNTNGTRLKAIGPLFLHAGDTAVSATNEWVKINTNGVVQIEANIVSTSTTTGALVVANGVGIAGNTYIGGSLFPAGVLTFTAQMNPSAGVSISHSTGATLVYSGGTSGHQWNNNANSAAIMSLSNAGILSVPNTTASTSTTTGALTVAGGIGVAGAASVADLTVTNAIRTNVALTTGAKTQARYFPMNINGTVVNVLTD